MAINPQRSLIEETVFPGVQVIRFLRPDLREQLEEDGDECALFRELRAGIVGTLKEGETLVLNLGLVEPVPSAFYSCLLRVRELVLARRARLLLCRLSPEHQELFQLFHANRLFQVTGTEAQALSTARTSATAR
jgi:hypothetical protein